TDPGRRQRDFFSYSSRRKPADHWLHDDGTGRSGEVDNMAAGEAASLLCLVTCYRIRQKMAVVEPAAARKIRPRWLLHDDSLISWDCFVSFSLPPAHAKTP